MQYAPTWVFAYKLIAAIAMHSVSIRELNLPFKTDLESNHGVGAFYAGDGLKFIVDYVLQMTVVDGVDAGHEIVATHDADAAHDFRNFFEGFNNRVDVA